jgi:hypothetical protein
MFTKPRCGWTNLTFNEFNEHASYLTDVPIDSLNAFTFAINNYLPATVLFDGEEIGQYIFVSDYYDSYIINDEDRLIKIHKGKIDLAKELLNDITDYYEDWCHWGYKENYYEKSKPLIAQKIDDLKIAIANYEDRVNKAKERFPIKPN